MEQYNQSDAQAKAVQNQEDNLRVRFPKDANTFIDVEILSEASMEQSKQPDASRAIQQELNTELDGAMESWSRLDQEPSTAFRQRQEHAASNPPRLTDPAVGSRARYFHQWDKWTQEPAVDPSQVVPAALFAQPRKARVSPHWWMRPDKGSPQPAEQSRIESAALPASSHRTPSTPGSGTLPPTPSSDFSRDGYRPAPPPPQRFLGQELSAPEAQRVAPKLPFRYPQLQYSLQEEGLGPEDFVDDEFDPTFWEKRPPRGDIWAHRFLDSPSYVRKDSEPISPGTMILSSPGVLGRKNLSFAARMEAARRNQPEAARRG
ncbi:hypothetical protein B0H67DRAFT_588381 [Lasiosphaeris hirsuta]|uniref:Uncharacterized protein n=1 Tax=Lasiosphaeris hirsuta TaxID=260670 RepID=A0AA40DNI4_9PEZI|nr:hypothetical protein B0H67DRAFT_588381 [Lasiosphaeris hirsuta]